MIVLEEFDYIKDRKYDVSCDVCVVICGLDEVLKDVFFE